MSLLLDVRDQVTRAATFWMKEVNNGGVRLTLREASPRVRYGLVTGYELKDARLAHKVLARGDRVLELGSAVGFLALFCRKQLGIRDYAMVEANPRLIPLIEENFRLNGLRPRLLFNVVVGPEDGEASFGINRDYWSSSTVTRAHAAETLTLPQRSIPSLLAELPFKPNTLIIDIEGGEAAIPLDHWLLFDKIIGEFHERLVGEAAIERITDALLAAGYTLAGSDGRSRAYVRQPSGES